MFQHETTSKLDYQALSTSLTYLVDETKLRESTGHREREQGMFVCNEKNIGLEIFNIHIHIIYVKSSQYQLLLCIE